jgi:RNA polymerase sigma-70 factor (ECF subfamily)
MTAQAKTDAIWSHFSADLRQFIRRRVADEHTADDLLQEAFVRVHRNIGALQEADRLAAWVYQIARNVVHDHHRSRATSTMVLESDELLDDSATQEPSSACGGIAWLNEMIRALPDGYREAVQLAEIDDLPQQDVAERLGLSLSGAKSRIQRGRAMLKDALQQCCSFELDGRGRVMGCEPRPNQQACHGCGN